MNKNEAKELLSFHSTRNEDIDNMITATRIITCLPDRGISQ